MAHEITPFQDDPFLEIGRILHSESYKREKKEIEIEGMKFDIIRSKDENVVVAEIKKSSKFLESATMQLCFYLYNLKRIGIDAKGEILIPKEKKRFEIILDDEKIDKIKKAMSEIKEIIKKEKPPEIKKIKFCKNCAYKEFCFS
ncbi:MAG: CRISPR-associated protein Cas4 [bacterium]|nr:CRISPR-associated protein Cas4 [bacterium]MDW8163782.1 CRISPR-associated protein Cas4 [Candidatus Omnitrophota bacterium]